MPRPQKHTEGSGEGGRRRARPGPQVDRQEVVSYPGAEYDEEEVELLRAVASYRQEHGIRFPAVTDILKVLKGMGYRR